MLVLLLQVPPPVILLNDVHCPAHKDVLPVIVAGNGFTVNVIDVEQLPIVVHVIVTVPVNTPVTRPVGSIVTMEVLLLLQNPGVTASLNRTVEFIHTEDGPVIEAGGGVTVTVAVAAQEPIA